jgi:hypothetical protein
MREEELAKPWKQTRLMLQCTMLSAKPCYNLDAGFHGHPPSKAWCKTSSIRFTSSISMLAMMAAGTSCRSFLLRSGSITLLMPHRCAASICETSRSQEQDYSLCVEQELLECLSFFSNKQLQHFFYSCIEEPQKTKNWWQKLQQCRHRKLGCVSVYHFTSLLFYTCMRGEEWLTIKLKS